MTLSMDERLFAGVFSTGISYADRGVERDGDYARRGFLSFGTLELELELDCPAAMAAEILEEARVIQAKRGQAFVVSTVGQTVRLGSNLSPDAAPAIRFPVPSTMPVRLQRQRARRAVEDALACKATDLVLAMVGSPDVKLDVGDCNALIAEAAFHRAETSVIDALIERRALAMASAPVVGNAAAAFQNALNEALRWAAVADDIPMMGALVTRGAEPAADHSLAMRWAAEKGAGDAVRWLIERGANPRANCNEALRTAAQRGAKDMVRILLDAGAEPAQWKGRILQTIENVREEAQHDSTPVPGCG